MGGDGRNQCWSCLLVGESVDSSLKNRTLCEIWSEALCWETLGRKRQHEHLGFFLEALASPSEVPAGGGGTVNSEPTRKAREGKQGVSPLKVSVQTLDNHVFLFQRAVYFLLKCRNQHFRRVTKKPLELINSVKFQDIKIEESQTKQLPG